MDRRTRGLSPSGRAWRVVAAGGRGFGGLDYATEYLLPNTVTSLAAGLECIALIFIAGQRLT